VTSELHRAFPRQRDRDLITHPLYQVVDWGTGQLITYTTVELTLGIDGYQVLVDDAVLGRQVSQWRARSPHLAALLDAEAALDALAGKKS
jgi:hypothetical protein